MNTQQEAVDRVADLLCECKELKTTTDLRRAEAMKIAEKELFNGNWLTTNHEILVDVSEGHPRLVYIDEPVIE